MIEIYKMADAAYPDGATLPVGFYAAAGYIGGERAAHVWSKRDWVRLGRIRKLPIWVPSNTSDGEDDGFAALRVLYDLGVPRGNAVAYDKETDVNPEQVRKFERVMNRYGYRAWCYGSASTVFRNAAACYWVADYTEVPFMYTHPGVRATQYANDLKSGGLTYDASTVKRWSYYHRLRKW